MEKVVAEPSPDEASAAQVNDDESPEQPAEETPRDLMQQLMARLPADAFDQDVTSQHTLPQPARSKRGYHSHRGS